MKMRYDKNHDVFNKGKFNLRCFIFGHDGIPVDTPKLEFHCLRCGLKKNFIK